MCINELKDAKEHLTKEVYHLKRQEAELKKSISILRSRCVSSSNGIIAVSLEGDILGFNQQFLGMWQIPDSRMLSNNSDQWQAFCESQLKNPEAFRKLMWNISAESDVDSYDILELKDGRVFAQYSQPQWLGDKIIGRLCSVWDITEYKRAEELLQLNQTRWHTLAEKTDASIFVIQGGNLSYINPAAEILSGYTKQELLSGIDPRQLIKNKKRRKLHNQKLQYQELKILAKNGKEHWLGCVVTMLDYEETPVKIIAGIDITDYKKAESNLHEALAQAKQVSEVRAHFMSMVCHQFRTPLNVVSFSNSLLKRRINEWMEVKTLPLVDHIQSAVEQITKMLDDILLFSKAETAQLKFEAQPLDIVQFCNDLIVQIQKSGSQQPINFMSQGGELTAYMDQKLLEPIFRNLLDNAIKYSPTGSPIDVKLYCECGKIIFQVTDRGVGIPVTDIQRVFEPFYRGRNIDNLPGTGLGLSIVKTLVDLHGGHTAIESQVDVGTTVTIMLPLMKSKS
ncbi:MAG: PAS domain-containing sensor histidine kinase [Nostoc sp. LLA-1]|nr:PAS domain-containing sensor histidine kinase [Cyanocohniella sp. LLY]